MRFAIEVLTDVAGIPLEVLILTALLRGSFKRYPAPFTYVAALFVTTVLEAPLYITGYLNLVRYDDRRIWMQWHSCYWVDRVILIALEFVVVISLIWQATSKVRPGRILRLGVSGGAVLVAAVTFAVHYDGRVATGRWLTPWASNLHFCAAVLDLGLWALLAASRKRDEILLMLSGALGILFTGGAIGESVRNLSQARQSQAVTLVGNIVIVAANLTFLYIWLQALRGGSTRQSRDPGLHAS